MTILTDREVSIGCVVAYVLWGCVLLLLTLGWWLDEPHLGQFGLAASAAAATATIRSYFVRQNRMMRNAFELGRDSAGATPTPIRRG